MWSVLAKYSIVVLICAGFTSRDYYDNQDFDLERIKKINLVDENNQSLQLKQDIFRPLNLFVFLSPECPLCKNYTKALNKINNDFSADSVRVIGVISGKAYSALDVKDFKNEFAVNFQLFIDPAMKLTTYLQATITPEVVLINDKGKLIYRGAIDDWVTELGKNKLRPEKEYLRLAVTQYINHQPISIKKTRPKGCYINEY